MTTTVDVHIISTVLSLSISDSLTVSDLLLQTLAVLILLRWLILIRKPQTFTVKETYYPSFQPTAILSDRAPPSFN